MPLISRSTLLSECKLPLVPPPPPPACISCRIATDVGDSEPRLPSRRLGEEAEIPVNELPDVGPRNTSGVRRNCETSKSATRNELDVVDEGAEGKKFAS